MVQNKELHYVLSLPEVEAHGCSVFFAHSRVAKNSGRRGL